ncbi:MAG: VWA domain-containing protein, partial [Acidobacteriota bacterium]
EHRILKYHGSRFDGKDLILPAGTWLEVELQDEWRLMGLEAVFSRWEPPEAARFVADRGESDPASTDLAGIRPDRDAAEVSLLPDPEIASDTPHYVTHVDRVNLEVVVKDRKGRIIQNLRREDFRVFENGIAREILEYSWRQNPISAAILVDQSGSIEPYKKELREATLRALGEFSDRDRFTLFFFNHQVNRIVDLTSDRELIAGQIEQLRSSGLTNLFDPIFCAAHYLSVAARELGHAIILISDNRANSVRYAGAGCALRMVLETGTVVYSLRLPSSNPVPLPADAPPSWNGDLNCIEEIVNNSGGEVVDLREERDLSTALHRMVERLRLRYSLSIIPSQGGASGFRVLEVELSPRFGKPNRDYFIAARRGYYYRSAFER